MPASHFFAATLLSLAFLFSCQPAAPPSAAPVPVAVSPALAANLEEQLAEAKALADSGAVEPALEIMTAALRLAADSLGERHPLPAQFHHELGNLFNNHFQNLDSALVHFAKAAELRRQLLPELPDLAPELAKSYFALARVQRLKGLLQPALENVHLCLALREAAQPQDSTRLGRTCFEAGVLYREAGDLENALRYLRQAVVFYENDPETNAESLANAWNETASTHDLLRQPEAAVEFYQKALAAYRSLADPAQEAGCLTNLGGAFLRSENFAAALPALQKALEINGQLLEADTADANLRLARSAILDNLGIFFKRTGQSQAAIAAARQSLELAQRACGTNFHPAVAGSFDNLGNAFLAAGQPAQALQNYRQGISCIVPEFTDSSFLKNPNLASAAVSEKPLLLTLLRDKAEAAQLLAKTSADSAACLRAAFDAWRSADTLLLQIRQSCREDGSKFFLAEEAAPMYEQALSLAFEEWERTADTVFRNAALAFCERNKAGVLLESLQEIGAKRQAGSGFAEPEQALRQAIARQELAVFHAQQAGNAARSQAARDSLFLLKRQMERLARQFEKEAPGWFHQKFALAQPPPPHELQQRLPPGTALFEYFLGDSALFTLCLTRQSFHLHRTALPGNFLQMADQFRRSVADWDFVQNQPAEAEAAYLETAPALFEFLLKKPLEMLAAEDLQRLVIVPDGALGYLPFEALLTQRADSWKQKNLPCLLRRLAVSYAYSAHFLTGKIQSAKGKGFAGFGLTYDEQTLLGAGFEVRSSELDSALQGTGETRGKLGKLPFSAAEVSEIAGLMGGRCWLDSAATKANFLRHAPGSGILHFAGHGFTDARHPLNSALLFSKNTDSTDCLLRAADLYGLRLDARLAVLSACNTGYGELRRGEGIMSFARAFAGAGVPAVVMSLWSVTDASTANVMRRFYASLKSGEPKDVALRNAKLGYLESATPERALPIYWAGAVVMGDASPVGNLTGMAWWKWVALLAGGLAAVMVAVRFFRIFTKAKK